MKIRRETALKKASKVKDPKMLAVQYFAPIYLMMNLYDNAGDKAAIARMVEKRVTFNKTTD